MTTAINCLRGFRPLNNESSDITQDDKHRLRKSCKCYNEMSNLQGFGMDMSILNGKVVLEVVGNITTIG